MKTITFFNDVTASIVQNSTSIARDPEHFQAVGFMSCGVPTGTSPTLSIIMQHSMDDQNWADLMTFSVANSASAQYAFTQDVPLLPYIRGRIGIGGATPVFPNLVVKLFLQGQ